MTYENAPWAVYVLAFHQSGKDEVYFTTDEDEARAWSEKYHVMKVDGHHDFHISADGVELFDPEPPFHEYLRDNMFHSDRYVIENEDYYNADVRVYVPDGEHIAVSHATAACHDDNITVERSSEGWLCLTDER